MATLIDSGVFSVVHSDLIYAGSPSINPSWEPRNTTYLSYLDRKKQRVIEPLNGSVGQKLKRAEEIIVIPVENYIHN